MKIGNQFAWNGRVSSYLYAMKEHIFIYSDSRINHNKVRGIIYFEISGFTWLPPKVLNQQKNMRNLQQVHNKLHLQFESTAIIWMDSHSKNLIYLLQLSILTDLQKKKKEVLVMLKYIFHIVYMGFSLCSMIFKILLIFLDNVQFANCAMNFYFVSCRIPFAIVNMTNTTVLHTTLENINFYYKKKPLILPSYMSQISVGRFSIL